MEEKIPQIKKNNQKRRHKPNKGQQKPAVEVKGKQPKAQQQQPKAFNVLKPAVSHVPNPKVLDYSVQLVKVNEPKTMCKLCSQKINSIAEAISEGDDGYSHFDCVISKLAQQEDLKPDEKISYIGKGVFAVVRITEDNKFEIIKRIAYETNEQYANHKRFVEDLKL